MRVSCIISGVVGAVVVLAVLMLFFGVNFRHTDSSSLTYSQANEVLVSGVVQETQQFACPVSEGEMGDHVILKTDQGLVLVHLAPGRVLRGHNIAFKPGQKMQVLGSRGRYNGMTSLIAREVTTDTDVFQLRDASGKLLMKQY